MTSPLLTLLASNRRVGETLVEVADRMLTYEALVECEGNQTQAAKVVGWTAHTMKMKAANYRLRPMDKHIEWSRLKWSGT